MTAADVLRPLASREEEVQLRQDDKAVGDVPRANARRPIMQGPRLVITFEMCFV